MSEILRAVLDATCVFSAPAFYTIQLPQINDGSFAFRNMGARLQLKSDRWFLQTGIMVFNTVGQPVYQDIGVAKLVSLFDAATGHQYFDTANMLSTQVGRNVTDYLTFPDYILWKPNQTVGVSLNVQSHDAAYLNYVVLGGIEYAR